MKKWNKPLQPNWITGKIVDETVIWAEEFGHYLADGIKKDEFGQPIQATNRDGSSRARNGKPEYEKQAPLSTSQLRKFFGEIRRMQAEIMHERIDPADKQSFNKTSLLMLKPKLAYQVGREKDKLGKIRDFYTELSKGVDAVQTRGDFKNFVSIVEAIVAYHKEKESEKTEVKSEP